MPWRLNTKNLTSSAPCSCGQLTKEQWTSKQGLSVAYSCRDIPLPLPFLLVRSSPFCRGKESGIQEAWVIGRHLRGWPPRTGPSVETGVRCLIGCSQDTVSADPDSFL